MEWSITLGYTPLTLLGVLFFCWREVKDWVPLGVGLGGREGEELDSFWFGGTVAIGC